MCMEYRTIDRLATSVWKLWRRLTFRTNITVYKVVAVRRRIRRQSSNKFDIETPFTDHRVCSGDFISNRKSKHITLEEMISGDINQGIHTYVYQPTAEEQKYLFGHEYVIKCNAKIKNLVMRTYGKKKHFVFTEIEIPQAELDRIIVEHEAKWNK